MASTSNNVDPLGHDYSSIFKLLPDPQSVDDLVVGLNKMKLDSKLDLSAHPANSLVNLPYWHMFNNFAGFCHTVANTTNKPHILRLLVKIIEYNLKIIKNYKKWKSSAKAKKLKKLEKQVDTLEMKSEELEKQTKRRNGYRKS